MKSIMLAKQDFEPMQILGDIYRKSTAMADAKSKIKGFFKHAKTSSSTAEFSKSHPRIFFFAALIGMPALLTGVVFAGTFAVMFPISTLLGWI